MKKLLSIILCSSLVLSQPLTAAENADESVAELSSKLVQKIGKNIPGIVKTGIKKLPDVAKIAGGTYLIGVSGWLIKEIGDLQDVVTWIINREANATVIFPLMACGTYVGYKLIKDGWNGIKPKKQTEQPTETE